MQEYILRSTNKIPYKSLDYPLADRYLYVTIKDLKYDLHNFNITFKREVKYAEEKIIQAYSYDEVLDITTPEIIGYSLEINAEDKDIGRTRVYDSSDINAIFRSEIGKTISKTKDLEVDLLYNINAAILYDLNNDTNFQSLGISSFEFI